MMQINLNIKCLLPNEIIFSLGVMEAMFTLGRYV